ncbi:MAG: ATP-binding cassette domain-containing protein, partial [Chryseobacterium sp.]|nr:ATP-binding cassette domain-containing protein [Chryseobacterium sp.]
ENFPIANGRTISASQFLRLFLFDDQTQYAPISKLSGGEKRRLHLMYVLYQNPNFLIFDEPTNDLDLPTLTVLENFLQQFQGTLIIVSHDRYFMDRIVEHCLAFEGNGRIKDFVGTFSEYREFDKKQISDGKEVKIEKVTEFEKKLEPKPIVKKEEEVAARKLSFKEKSELDKLNKEIPEFEVKRSELSKLLNNETDYDVISKLSDQLQKLSDNLDEMELRWLELQE